MRRITWGELMLDAAMRRGMLFRLRPGCRLLDAGEMAEHPERFADRQVDRGVQVRKPGDTRWRAPTYEYCFGNE